MKLPRLLIGILTTFFLAGLAHAQEQAPAPEPSEEKVSFVMISQLDPAKRKHARYVQMVYGEAFRRLGLEMVFKHYPPARASKLADSGKVDGELSRGSQYNNAHPVLVRVNEPAFSIRFSAFATNPEIELGDWDDLDGTTYRVEYRIGSRIAHEQLTKRVPSKNLSAVTHESLGISKLFAGRTDIYVHEEEAVTELMDSEEFRAELQEMFGTSMIHRIAVLEELTIHAFLHERHKELAPRLSTVLKTMKAEGLFQHYDQLAKSP